MRIIGYTLAALGGICSLCLTAEFCFSLEPTVAWAIFGSFVMFEGCKLYFRYSGRWYAIAIAYCLAAASVGATALRLHFATEAHVATRTETESTRRTEAQQAAKQAADMYQTATTEIETAQAAAQMLQERLASIPADQSTNTERVQRQIREERERADYWFTQRQNMSAFVAVPPPRIELFGDAAQRFWASLIVALLIEIAQLECVSLAKSQESKRKRSNVPRVTEHAENEPVTDMASESHAQADVLPLDPYARLIRAFRSGEIEPTSRKVRSFLNISQEATQSLMRRALDDGYLVRNGVMYRLKDDGSAKTG